MKACGIALSLALLTPAALSQGAPLAFTTSDQDVAGLLREGLGTQQELPELEAGMRWEFVLDAGRQVGIGTQVGEAVFFECTARPRELMEMFEDTISARSAMLQGMVAIGLRSMGVKPRDAVRLYRALLELPLQMAEAKLVVVGDPRAAGGEGPSVKELLTSGGFSASLAVEAVAGTWLDRFVRGLEPSKSPPPAVAGDDAHMVMLWSLSQSDPAARAPFTEIFASLYSDAGGSLEQRIEMVEEGWAAWDGTMAMTFDFGSQGYSVLEGISDPERMQRLHARDDFRSWIATQYQASFQLDPSTEEVEFVADGFEYRDVKLHKTLQQNADGERFGVVGIVEQYAVAAMGLPEGDVHALLDRVIDGQIEHAPLPEGVLGVLRLRHLPEWDLGRGGPGNMQGAPDGVDFTFAKSGNRLVLRVEIE